MSDTLRRARGDPGPGAGPPTGTGPSRILFVAPQPFYEDRGTPIAVRQVLEALARIGYEVDLITYPVGRDLDLPGVRVLRPPNLFGIRQVKIGFSWKKVLLDATLLPLLWRRLRRGEYLCAHAVEEAAFPAVALGHRYGLPVIYDMQSSLPEQLASRRIFRNRVAQFFLRRCERWLLSHADCVVCSRGLGQKVRRQVSGTPVREWTYSTGGSSVGSDDARELRKQLGLDPLAPVVLYSGSFAAYQGLSELVASVPRVRAAVPGIRFVLLGAEGDRGRRLREQAKRLDLGSAIQFVERRPREEVPRFLAMADVLVSPRTDGRNLPLKIFEYLAAGKAIVASDIPAHRSVLDAECAVLVEPSPEGYGDGITRLLQDSEARERLESRARARSAGNGGAVPFDRSVSELYGEMAKLRRRRRLESV